MHSSWSNLCLLWSVWWWYAFGNRLYVWLSYCKFYTGSTRARPDELYRSGFCKSPSLSTLCYSMGTKPYHQVNVLAQPYCLNLNRKQSKFVFKSYFVFQFGRNNIFQYSMWRNIWQYILPYIASKSQKLPPGGKILWPGTKLSHPVVHSNRALVQVKHNSWSNPCLLWNVWW